MNTDQTSFVQEKLQSLRRELVDLAFDLDCRGHLHAADTALMISYRLEEFCQELVAAKPQLEAKHSR